MFNFLKAIGNKTKDNSKISNSNIANLGNTQKTLPLVAPAPEYKYGHGTVTIQKISFYDEIFVSNVSTRFIAFDTETTGFNPQSDRIVQVGATLFLDGKPSNSYSSLVNPLMHIPTAASNVNHITDDMVISAPSERQVCKILVDFFGDAFCDNTIIVSHNADFDMRFLKSLLERNGINANIRYADTLTIARNYLGKSVENHKQQTLARHFGINVTNAHNADDDAVVCGYIMMNLLNYIKKENEIAYEEIKISPEDKGVCAYLTKIVGSVHETERMRFEVLSSGISLVYPYKVIEFKVTKKMTIKLTYRTHDSAWKKEELQSLGDLEHFKNIIAEQMDNCEEGFDWYKTHFSAYKSFLSHSFQIAESDIDSAIQQYLVIEKQIKENLRLKELEKTQLDIAREQKRVEREQKKINEAEKKANSIPNVTQKRKVGQYDDNMNLIHEFESITEASKTVGVSTKCIRDAATGKQKHAGGYVWKYMEINDDLKDTSIDM